MKARTQIAALLFLGAAACVGGQTGADDLAIPACPTVTLERSDAGTQQVAPYSVLLQVSALSGREAEVTWSGSTLQVLQPGHFDEAVTMTFMLLARSCEEALPLQVTSSDDRIDDTFACHPLQDAGRTALRCELRGGAYLTSKFRARLAGSRTEAPSAGHWLALRLELFSSGSITLMDGEQTVETLGSLVFDQDATGR